MERLTGGDFVAHLITDPKIEDPAEVQGVVKSALCGEREGGVIIKLRGVRDPATFSSEKLRRIKNPTPQGIDNYAAMVTSMIITEAETATIFEYPASS